jgi:AcrR family transcriptional regulator
MTMIAKDPVQSRPGGRSSRVQASVHQAVRKLLEHMPREELTFPLIATEAGVTPSTLYRRWGDLPQLLADVALERIRPIAEPADTGSLHGDLQAWTEQYIEEMGSPLGRTLLRDTLVATQEDQVTCACVDIIRDQLGIVLGRARARGEEVPMWKPCWTSWWHPSSIAFFMVCSPMWRSGASWSNNWCLSRSEALALESRLTGAKGACPHKRLSPLLSTACSRSISMFCQTMVVLRAQRGRLRCNLEHCHDFISPSPGAARADAGLQTGFSRHGHLRGALRCR